MISREELYLSKCLAEMSRVYERNTKKQENRTGEANIFSQALLS